MPQSPQGHGTESFFLLFRSQRKERGDMSATLKRLTPGILVAVGAAVIAGLAIAVKRAGDFDLDFDLNWDDLPA
jgi:preprotein translocase subunit YajC